MKQKTVFFTRGPMGSGKSYWARKYAQRHKNVKIISTDVIRMRLLTPEDDYFSKEKEMWKIFYAEGQKAINDPNVNDVIFDATYLTDKAIARTLQHLNIPKEVKVIEVKINTPLEKCYKQNAGRTGRAFVPNFVIKNAYNLFQMNKTIDWVRKRINETWEVGNNE